MTSKMLLEQYMAERHALGFSLKRMRVVSGASSRTLLSPMMERFRLQKNMF